jgi:hypothetical protein
VPPFIALTAHFLTALFIALTSPLFPPLFKLAEFGYDREVLQEAYAWQHRGNTNSLIMLLRGLQPMQGLNVEDTVDMHRTAALPPTAFPLTSLFICPEVHHRLHLCLSSNNLAPT